MYVPKMGMATAVAAWALTAVCQNTPIGRNCNRNNWPRGSPDYSQLQSQLSPGAQIYYQNSTQFDEATKRWSALDEPSPNVVVVPATEHDVVVTVQYANQYDTPFLAYTGSHGSITTLGQMKTGIEIDMKQLNSIVVAPDGQTATFGGGAMSVNVTNALWAAGKQTVTGTCECVSYLGPGLGGGHGWLQGHHGLVADQFVSMNVVLADGSLKTIDQKSDLFWAMQGAGHNFGIITSVTSKVYDIVHPNWAIVTFIFSGSKVEQVYQAANDHLLQNGTQPADVINWSYWLNIPSFDPNNPVILFYVIQEGVNAVDSAYTQPFYNIGPLSATPQSGTYKDLASWTGISLSQGPCQDVGLANPRFPIYLQEYNVATQSSAYTTYANAVRGNSAFNGSIFMFEGYSMEGVHAVKDCSTAFAWRSENILAAPLIQYTSTDSTIDSEAKQLGDQLRQILYQGSGLSNIRAYVNYAYGDESVEELYGYANWRQTKLQNLKNEYDPHGRFDFYAPIP